MKDAITIIRGLIDAGIPAEHAITAAEYISKVEASADSPPPAAEVQVESHDAQLDAITRRAAKIFQVTPSSMRRQYTTHDACRARASCYLEARDQGVTAARIAEYYGTSKNSVWNVFSKANAAATSGA